VRCSLAVAFFGSFFGKGKKNKVKNGHWSLVIGHWSLVNKLVINTTSFLFLEFKKSNESCHFYLKKL